jgi:hypothetical protein
VRGGIEPQPADLEHRRPLDRSAAGERAQPRDELRERERLGQVVVGAAVQAAHAVLDGVPRREHQHRGPHAAPAEAPAGLEAVHPREHHVEHERVVVRGPDRAQRLLAVGRDVDHEPFEAQAAPDRRRHPHVVLDHEHPHSSNHPRGAESPLRARSPGSPKFSRDRPILRA